MSIPELAAALLRCERIAVIAHIAPDGDTLGSALAIRRALLLEGKRAVAVCQDPPPRMYAFFPDIDTLITPGQMPFVPDCAVLVDISSEDRAGDALPIFRAAPVRLVIDHHETNEGFFDLGAVCPNASSSGEMVVSLLDAMGRSIDPEMAGLLYAAIATDTGNFSFSNTTPEAFYAAARFLEAGLPLDAYNRRLFRSRTLPRTRMIGEGLRSLEMARNGRIAWTRLTREMFERADAAKEDTEGLVNYLSEIEGVQLCFTAEDRGDETKISLRSDGTANVAKIARDLGGGGHARAAGVTIPLPLEGAVFKVLGALTRALE